MDTETHIRNEVARQTAQLTKKFNDEKTELVQVVQELQEQVILQKALLDNYNKVPVIKGLVQKIRTKPNEGCFQTESEIVVIDSSLPSYRQSGKVVSENPIINDKGEVLIKLTVTEEVLPLSIGTQSKAQVKLVGVADGTYAIVNIEGNNLELKLHPFLDIKVGDSVGVFLDSKQIVSFSNDSLSHGPIVKVKSISGFGIEVIDKAETKQVQNPLGFELEENDQVVVDAHFSVVLAKLPKNLSNRYKIDKLEVNWSDIGGLELSKRKCLESIELPFKYPELCKHYSIKRPTGIIFHGIPGCGKTMLVQASITAYAKLHGRTVSDSGCLYVKSPEILDKYIGITELEIRELFSRCRTFYRKNGFPALLVFEEFDAIAPQRGTRRSSDIADTIVPMFLGEMDGADKEQTSQNPIVVITTNRIGSLDPAIIRRCGTPIRVDRPDVHSATTIFNIYCENIPFLKEDKKHITTTVAIKEIFSTSRLLYRINNEYEFCLRDALTGDMLKQIVEESKKYAIHDDITNGTMTGISIDHVRKAINLLFEQQKGLNHNFDLQDFADRNGLQVENMKIERCFGAA